eukprot:1816039-Amphidinium_carterae.1
MKPEKEIKPNYTVIDTPKDKILRLRYKIGGRMFIKDEGFKRIGLDKAREFLEQYFHEQMHEYKGISVDVDACGKDDNGILHAPDGAQYITL